MSWWPSLWHIGLVEWAIPKVVPTTSTRQPPSFTAISAASRVLIGHPAEGRRLSWPVWWMFNVAVVHCSEKHKVYHQKDEALTRDGFKKFMKYEECQFAGCIYSHLNNHIHCIRPGCTIPILIAILYSLVLITDRDELSLSLWPTHFCCRRQTWAIYCCLPKIL